MSLEFADSVKLYIQHADGNRLHLAREFEVALSTIDRWALGTATPHPRLQNQVLQYIIKNFIK